MTIAYYRLPPPYDEPTAIAGLKAYVRARAGDLCVLRPRHDAEVASDISTWLTLRGHRPPKEIGDVIDSTVNNVETCSTAGAAAAAAGITLTRMRSALEPAGLPNPREFFQIVRLLTIAVTLQRNVDISLSTVAESHGYWDAAARRPRLQDVFGAAPTDIRRCLGWEWLLFQALRRAGVDTARH